jgi:hypothetical protein
MDQLRQFSIAGHPTTYAGSALDKVALSSVLHQSATVR